MSELKKVLEELELLESLIKVPVVIRHDDTIALGNGLLEAMSRIGIWLDVTKPTHLDDFIEFLREKGFDLGDFRTIKIRRKIVTRESLGTLK